MKTILLVDDHPMIRKGIRALVESLPEAHLVLEAGTRVEAQTLLESNDVDLAVVDLVLGAEDGLDFIKEITHRFKNLKVLVMSMQPEALYAERVLKAGALGMVSKSDEHDQVLAAVQTVMLGEFYLTRATQALVLKKLLKRSMPKGDSPVSQLSDRELHVFQMLGTGYTTAEVAEHLGLSRKTVEAHREKIKRKLKIKDAKSLVAAASVWVQGDSPGDFQI
ncbi:MAG: response regulator transcription factor [Verrucomicrobia bacterium]|nr:response regulator transcription factor [Verrucomicrobiota bacterium]MCH8513689.1 response regulator transcription factor [Kiritimatiellia bacterium]